MRKKMDSTHIIRRTGTPNLSRISRVERLLFFSILFFQSLFFLSILMLSFSSFFFLFLLSLSFLFISYLLGIQGASRVLFYHNFSVSKALLDLFPNIGLQEALFPSPPKWNSKYNRRVFFSQYAIKHGFDASNPEHWYKQSREAIMSAKGAAGVITYYKRNVTKALLDLFPEIGLDGVKLEQKCT